MFTALMVFHAIISVLIIVLVLLQFGKGAEAGLMSGGASDSVMSTSQQGNILSKITIVLAVIFMANSILLAKIQSKRSSTSLLDSEAPVARPLNNDSAETTPESAPAETTPAENKAEKNLEAPAKKELESKNSK